MSVPSGQESIYPRESTTPQVNIVIASSNDPCLINRGIRYTNGSKGAGISGKSSPPSSTVTLPREPTISLLELEGKEDPASL